MERIGVQGKAKRGAQVRLSDNRDNVALITQAHAWLCSYTRDDHTVARVCTITWAFRAGGGGRGEGGGEGVWPS